MPGHASFCLCVPHRTRLSKKLFGRFDGEPETSTEHRLAAKPSAPGILMFSGISAVCKRPGAA
jgi:hypothetical protein